MKRVILRVMMLVAMASAAVTMSVHTSSKEVKASEKGDAVVEYAKNFVGNRYRYGGSSLTNGTDCSGFTRGVYKKFGKRLPHSSSAQRRYGKKVKGGIKNAQAGDLICYSGLLQSIWETTRSYMQVIQHHIQEVELRFQTMQDTEES